MIVNTIEGRPDGTVHAEGIGSAQALCGAQIPAAAPVRDRDAREITCSACREALVLEGD